MKKCSYCEHVVKHGDVIEFTLGGQKCPHCKSVGLLVDIDEYYDGESIVQDEVNHIEPSHYTDVKISPLEYIEANEHLTWSLSNAIKYISRAGKKENNPRLQDLEKALWYLNHEIELEKEK